MPLFSETKETIFGNLMIDLLDNTSISRSSPGSKMRAIAEAVSKKQGQMWSQFDLNIGQAFVDGAQGRFLSFIGELYNVPRLGEVAATIISSSKNLKVYVEVGTFGGINGGSSITLPAGTIISTSPAGTGTRYRTIVNTVLLAGVSETYISVQSVRSGSVVNVGANRLIYHDFIDYADSTNETLKVTNEGDVQNGQDGESDTNYRFRIVNQVIALESSNETAIRLAALVVPGVADITVIPFHRGIGTFDLLVKSTTPNISVGLLNSVGEAVSNVTSQGIIGTVRGPREVGVSLVGTLVLKKKISIQEESSLIGSVTSNVTDYTNTLDIGEDLVVNELLERVMSTSDMIKTVGIPTRPFDSLFIHKLSRLEDNKVRSSLTRDYSPADDERVIVENQYAGSTPILFRIAT